MSSDLDAVKRIVDAFEQSDWQEIDVRSGDLRVHLSTSGSVATSGTQSPPARAAVDPDPAESSGESAEDSADAEPEKPAIPDGAHVIGSPSPGIFWRAPEPGAPPFTDIGQVVEPTMTLCIIEVMKLMSHLKAGIGGEVVAIFVENGVAVEKGEALIAIMPVDGEQGS